MSLIYKAFVILESFSIRIVYKIIRKGNKNYYTHELINEHNYVEAVWGLVFRTYDIKSP